MKKIIFTPSARVDVRRIDRDTAMRLLTALDRFSRTGELRLRVGDYRVRFTESPPGPPTFTPSCTDREPTGERQTKTAGEQNRIEILT